MTKQELFDLIKGTIVVSCQATPGEPLYMKDQSIMYLMARAAKQAGAKMIRTSSVRDIVEIKEETGLPVIGLIKREYPGYTGRITMTMREVDECMEAMADIVSIDCTFNERADGLTPGEFLKQVKAKYPNIIIMADCATIEDIRNAFALGVDICSTTLSHPGAAIDCGMADGPTTELIRQAVAEFPGKPIICEGRVHVPEDAKKAMDAGAWAVVVGTGITHPTSITSWFVEAIS